MTEDLYINTLLLTMGLGASKHQAYRIQRSRLMPKTLKNFTLIICASFLTLLVPISIQAENPKDLGLVQVKSYYGRYLQSHDGFKKPGEMHASKKKPSGEETWHLVEVDRQRHIYALLNWKSQLFMNKRDITRHKLLHRDIAITIGCCPADIGVLDITAQWILVSGNNYGVPGAVAFKSVSDGTFLGTNHPGKNCGCGGEVSAQSAENLRNNGEWKGWWQIEPAKQPTPFWKKESTQWILKNLKPVAIPLAEELIKKIIIP